MQSIKKMFFDAKNKIASEFNKIEKQQKMFFDIGYLFEYIEALGEIHIQKIDLSEITFEDIEKAISIESQTEGYFQVEHISGARYELTEIKNPTYTFTKIVIPLATPIKILNKKIMIKNQIFDAFKDASISKNDIRKYIKFFKYFNVNITAEYIIHYIRKHREHKKILKKMEYVYNKEPRCGLDLFLEKVHRYLNVNYWNWVKLNRYEPLNVSIKK